MTQLISLIKDKDAFRFPHTSGPKKKRSLISVWVLRLGPGLGPENIGLGPGLGPENWFFFPVFTKINIFDFFFLYSFMTIVHALFISMSDLMLALSMVLVTFMSALMLRLRWSQIAPYKLKWRSIYADEDGMLGNFIAKRLRFLSSSLSSCFPPAFFSSIITE